MDATRTHPRVGDDSSADGVAGAVPDASAPGDSPADGLAGAAPDPSAPTDSPGALTRRALLGGALGALGGAALVGVPAAGALLAQGPAAAGQGAGSPGAKTAGTGAGAAAAKAAPTSATADALPPIPDDPTKVLGLPTSAVGVRSRFETPARTPTGEVTGNSLTPLHELTGTITPADLHFERHHAGIPQIDPTRHRLLVHGMVDRPMLFTLADLKRFPSVTRTYFIECSGNGRAAYQAPAPDMTPQKVDGLTANTEWTGVPLKLLLRAAGLRGGATWLLAEGSDACLMARSIPVAKALDDALVVYAQNGEPLRPAQGYPIRLLLPGWEGNMNVKWLRRIKLSDGPFMTRWETSKYTDPLPNDTARIFSFEMDVKSVITSPAYPAVLTGPGEWEITGIAWSGRGKVKRVDVSTDGGRTWKQAELQEPVLSKAHTRFRLGWRWDGRPAVLVSRALDDTGAEQPTRALFTRVRGKGTDFHFNHLRSWRVQADGRVTFDADGGVLA